MRKRRIPVWLLVLAVTTFVASWMGLFPSRVVESVYARFMFPWLSRLAAIPADTVPFSWLDLWVLLTAALVIYSVVRKRWMFLLEAVSALYLIFFWGWGLNYHRPPLSQRLHVQAGSLQKAERDKFADHAAQEINRLWPSVSKTPITPEKAGLEASSRVRRVVFLVDGEDWRAPARLKHSFLANSWFRIAGIDGMFNPFGHEPLVVSGLLPVETPFVMAHELAHVRGVANEGEANLIALLATVASDDPHFQYSGWLQLWQYLGKAPHTNLDPGPIADLAAIRDRIRSNEIEMVSKVQSAVLDAHLKANAVPEGIHSYSDFVGLAIATQQRWSEFR